MQKPNHVGEVILVVVDKCSPARPPSQIATWQHIHGGGLGAYAAFR
jgi:hypothetical protein